MAKKVFKTAALNHSAIPPFFIVPDRLRPPPVVILGQRLASKVIL
jgi:hypothetical protein